MRPAKETYRDLKPLDKVQAGDEFTWVALCEGKSPNEQEWYPCETFVGSTVERLTKRANIKFRRRVWGSPESQE